MGFLRFSFYFSLSNEPSNAPSLFRQIYHRPNCLNKHRWEHTRQWRETSKFILSKHQQVPLLEAAVILSLMGKDPTLRPSRKTSASGRYFRARGGYRRLGNRIQRRRLRAGVSAAMHLAPPPPVLGYGSVGRGWYSAQQQHQGTNARMYGLQPISSSLPNPSASGLRMHNYVIRAGGRLFRLFLGWLSSSSLTPTRAQY